MADYAETLFEAVGILLEKKIESIQFDKTIQATVTDASRAKEGIYTVSTGNARFIAYCTTAEYKQNDQVMVTIPQGNYDNQKIIIGKWVDNSNTPMIYQSPFRQLIDISNNLISGSHEQAYWANNNHAINGCPWDINIADFQASTVYSSNQCFWDSGSIYQQGYTRLGFSAQFSTWLSEYNTAFGNYGIAIEVTFKCLEVPAPNTFIKILTFDSDEFFGDVYNFESYYTQEKVYDISEYINYPITRIRLFLYQRNNFKDTSGEYIYDIIPAISTDFGNINPNIFVKDPYICLGIPVTDFDSDSAELLTNNTLTYRKFGNIQTRNNDNEKTIVLRWIHKYEKENIIKTVWDGEFPQGYEIRWYRFKIGASSDQFARADWQRFYGINNSVNETNGEWVHDNSTDDATNQLMIAFQPNVNYQTEALKAVIIKHEAADIARLVATSNTLTFTNQDDVRSQATLIDANALSIRYNDEEQGQYFLYNEAGDIGKNQDAEVRSLTAVFSRDTDIVSQKPILNVADCASITWTFPAADANTMIIPMTGPDETATPSPINVFTGVNTVGFTIKKHLNNAATQNTIRLEIVKDGVNFTAQVQPIFGTAGTNGSDYTLVLTWEDDKNGFDIAHPSENLVGELALYDQAGKIVDWPEDAIISCNWYVAEVDGATTIREQPQEDNEDIYYPIISNINSLTYGLSGNPDISYQPNEFYYFTTNGSNDKVFDLQQNDFVTPLQNDLRQRYRKKNSNESFKTKIEFRQIHFNQDPMNHDTGIISVNNSNAIEISNNEKVYYYCPTKRYFIKYKDRYIIDPWDTYQETETYYEPIQVKESVYRRVSTGTLDAVGGLTAAADNSNHKITISASGTVSIDSVFILQITLSNFGDFDLVTYYPIPLKNNSTFIVDYIEGPDRVRYDSSGTLDFNKNPYQITVRQRSGNNLVTYRHGYDNGNILPGYWRLLIPNLDLSETAFHPSLQDTPNNNNTNGRFDKPILYPVSVYIPEAQPYAIQFVCTANNIESVLWTQPILLYENRYPSRTLNKWDGKSIVTDDDAGTITASGFSAGKKERDNSFTGVVIGDWSKSIIDSAISQNTGVYGFNHGAMAYAFKDDGTGFIGKDGSGRIYFNGDRSQIYSSRWLTDSEGMLLDIDDGYLKMQKNSKYITIGSNQSTYPLSIGTTSSIAGRKFKVDWNGKLYATDGYFNGEIQAATGNIGGWYIDETELRDGVTNAGSNTVLSSANGGSIRTSKGNIGNWWITAKGLHNASSESNTDYTVYLHSGTDKDRGIEATKGNVGGFIMDTNGFRTAERWEDAVAGLSTNGNLYANTFSVRQSVNGVTEFLGSFGLVVGSTIDSNGETHNTYNIGIHSNANTPTGNGESIIFEAWDNIRLTSGRNLYLQGSAVLAGTDTGYINSFLVYTRRGYMVGANVSGGPSWDPINSPYIFTVGLLPNSSTGYYFNGNPVLYTNIPAEDQHGIYARFA